MWIGGAGKCTTARHYTRHEFNYPEYFRVMIDTAEINLKESVDLHDNEEIKSDKHESLDCLKQVLRMVQVQFP